MSPGCYDHEARRDTPLAGKLRARIRSGGPITVSQYMDACLNDPEHGYYRTRSAIGRTGDFITAPEISQIFGELIGLWAAVVWQQMGAPRPVHLIELGPGRGTLMCDALRAARLVPDFRASVEVTLVERNPALRALQQQALAASGVPIAWLEDLAALREASPASRVPAPAIILANELLDCLPQDQQVRLGQGWLMRRVGLDAEGRLAFTPAAPPGSAAATSSQPRADLDRLYPGARSGDIVACGQHGWIDSVIATWPTVAALLIDYGHAEPAVGDTLQAVRSHRYEHPLTSPGEADLTMHVDFAALARQARAHHQLAVDGPVTQAELLGRLGIIERASRLMAASPAGAALIEAGVARLISPSGMGSRFKAMGLRSAHLPPLPGFAAVDNQGAVP